MCVCVCVCVCMCNCPLPLSCVYACICVCHHTCITSLHFSGAVVWFRHTVAPFEKAQYIMIGNRLVRKITCKKNKSKHCFNLIILTTSASSNYPDYAYT